MTTLTLQVTLQVNWYIPKKRDPMVFLLCGKFLSSEEFKYYLKLYQGSLEAYQKMKGWEKLTKPSITIQENSLPRDKPAIKIPYGSMPPIEIFN